MSAPHQPDRYPHKPNGNADYDLFCEGCIAGTPPTPTAVTLANDTLTAAARRLEHQARTGHPPLPNLHDLTRLADAAPALARVVLALAHLADDLEEEGTQGVNRQGRTLHDAGWHDSQIVTAARIQRILAIGHLDHHADEDGPTTGTDD